MTLSEEEDAGTTDRADAVDALLCVLADASVVACDASVLVFDDDADIAVDAPPQPASTKTVVAANGAMSQ